MAKGAEKYVATVPQVFDLWQDPQERYDIFMNNYTEHTWTMITISDAIKKLMATTVGFATENALPAFRWYCGPAGMVRGKGCVPHAGGDRPTRQFRPLPAFAVSGGPIE